MLFLKKNVSEFHLAAIQPQYSSGDRRIRRRIKDWIILSDWQQIYILTRMWANAQRDGRPAEYRWRLLFNAERLADAHYWSAVQ